MSIDIGRAASFLAAHGRVLDRRRFALLAGEATSRERGAVLAAVEGYRNGDGGFGWGLEPDLRAPESQPAGALHALEAIGDAGPETTPTTVRLFDWLDSVTLPDGGLPFALPIANPVACAPFWVETDSEESSLQITAGVAAQAHRVARFDERAKGHPWLERVTRFCFDAIGRMDEAPFAYVLSFALRFLDATADTHPEAHDLLRGLRQYVPADGAVPVAGGAEGEMLHLLDLAPEPGRAVRDLVDDDDVAADLDRLENGQQADGGWAVDFTSHSEAASLEWRGYATVSAVAVLRANGR
ncbi:hypothetical protein N8K70_03395 [Microbacterium betulae]|uniref:Prenyltransferase n=1 Tax=Microbacterium betulae TaxID=2981139 RepID=A0AA97FHM4_9MICO|nr:hypothetical protein [Microbacterium sp. AB]WOF23736.1 hypothetical protein N8K70_03395 [Microbacterium sp. AB]